MSDKKRSYIDINAEFMESNGLVFAISDLLSSASAGFDLNNLHPETLYWLSNGLTKAVRKTDNLFEEMESLYHIEKMRNDHD
ncbi:MAG: hypothetical protein KZQ64_07285 [gamma proteobacterium symbiont of Bathyaustriella thionipta]|nr:hypothetical protein [gamma proteobacterium symbiont of Bathyaustriella thionipta]MCU7951355.1 hypothetical protein [gamma proteobacterium symbiont of Bathyaustriella thionipta]MCU7953175.1 hypothetical protein [gamma proteobacterium symbiont of Bathyaustriella thionipta]MCU7957909.1 hypothetical protein [gamma proteobacterium symbiont of Bathyaustriella thionipta]MCU7965966.1 hypothetical protein [gamma proteobacterium symbiont of Bathyaustriella thionipta]